MSDRDRFSDSKPLVALQPQVINSDTTTVGETINAAGYEAARFDFMTGVLTDGDYVVALYEGALADMSDEAVVGSGNRVGDLPTFTADTNDAAVEGCVVHITKQYLRMKIVSTNNGGSGAYVAGLCTLYGTRHQPPLTTAHAAQSQVP